MSSSLQPEDNCVPEAVLDELTDTLAEAVRTLRTEFADRSEQVLAAQWRAGFSDRVKWLDDSDCYFKIAHALTVVLDVLEFSGEEHRTRMLPLIVRRLAAHAVNAPESVWPDLAPGSAQDTAQDTAPDDFVWPNDLSEAVVRTEIRLREAMSAAVARFERMSAADHDLRRGLDDGRLGAAEESERARIKDQWRERLAAARLAVAETRAAREREHGRLARWLAEFEPGPELRLPDHLRQQHVYVGHLLAALGAAERAPHTLWISTLLDNPRLRLPQLANKHPNVVLFTDETSLPYARACAGARATWSSTGCPGRRRAGCASRGSTRSGAGRARARSMRCSTTTGRRRGRSRTRSLPRCAGSPTGCANRRRTSPTTPWW